MTEEPKTKIFADSQETASIWMKKYLDIFNQLGNNENYSVEFKVNVTCNFIQTVFEFFKEIGMFNGIWEQFKEVNDKKAKIELVQ